MRERGTCRGSGNIVPLAVAKEFLLDRGGQKMLLRGDPEQNVEGNLEVVWTEKREGSPAKGMVHAKVLGLMGDNHKGRKGEQSWKP